MTTDAKKYLLLDPSNINRMTELFQPSNQRLQPLRAKEIRSLDTKMLDIINDQSLSEREKVAKYNSTLSEFQTISKEKFDPFREPPKDRNDGNNEAEDTYNELVGIPKTYRDKAKTLLSSLKASQNFQVTKKGEVIIGQDKIEGSNITDILNKAINPNVRAQSPTGWPRLQSVLKQSNIPQTILTNKVKRELKATSDAKKESKQRKVKSKQTLSLNKWVPY